MLISLTVPVTSPVRSPYTLATFKSLFRFQRSSAFVYVNVALAPSTVNPAPFAAAALAAPFATVILISSTANSLVLSVVVVPLTVKSPLIITLPLAVTVAAVISSVANCPLTVTLLNVTLSVVPTACPILISPLAIVTPVPALKSVKLMYCAFVLSNPISPVELLYVIGSAALIKPRTSASVRSVNDITPVLLS